MSQAEDEARTRDPQLGKLVLYQLSYSRGPTEILERPDDLGQSGYLTSRGFANSEVAPRSPAAMRVAVAVTYFPFFGLMNSRSKS